MSTTTHTPPFTSTSTDLCFPPKLTAVAKVEKVIQCDRDAAAMIRLAMGIRLVPHLFKLDFATKTVKLRSTFYVCLGHPRFYGDPYRRTKYVLTTAAAFLDACIDWLAKIAHYELSVDVLLEQLGQAVESRLQAALATQPLANRARYVAAVKQALWPFVLLRRVLSRVKRPESNDALVAVFANDALSALVASYLCAYSKPLLVM